MRLVSLMCSDFRNLERVEISPHPRFNILEGPNGQGKTNQLEAIYLLSTFRSFRDTLLADMIRWGADKATVVASVERRGIERRLALELTPRGKRLPLKRSSRR